MGDDQIAQDAVQDVFVKFWKKRKELGEDMNIKAYLFTSVKNKCLEILRREKMVERHEDNIRQVETLRHVDTIEQDIEKYVRLEKIYKAIKTLPDKCEKVFSMSKINGLSYQEISEFMGISVKTVENHMVRALKLLREKLNK